MMQSGKSLPPEQELKKFLETVSSIRLRCQLSVVATARTLTKRLKINFHLCDLGNLPNHRRLKVTWNWHVAGV